MKFSLRLRVIADIKKNKKDQKEELGKKKSSKSKSVSSFDNFLNVGKSRPIIFSMTKERIVKNSRFCRDTRDYRMEKSTK